MKPNAQYIWFNEEDTSRNPYAAFRRKFYAAADVQEAIFNIFADTTYKLYVNGTFVGFGPVRFDPRYPQYDTYDLAPFLTEGVNVIAVLVNFHGHKVFKSIPFKAAMIAWGQIVDANGITNLATQNESWKCKRCEAYDRYTPKLSFALNAQVHYDQKRFDEDWISRDYDDSNWPCAVELKDQNCFSGLTPRSIPFMSMENVPVNNAIQILPLANDEKCYSFFMELPYRINDGGDPPDYSKNVAWSTYIYSPSEQEITSAVLYETVWVNNETPEEKYEDEFKPLRYNFTMRLKQGWNYIFGTVKIYSDIYDCYLVVPEGRGLVLSADKSLSGERLFRHTKILKTEDDAIISAIPTPWPEDINIDQLGGWVYTTSKDSAANPCREASWDSYGPASESINHDTLNSFIFQKSKYPQGFVLIFDMEHMRLVFPQIKLKGVKGATIDILYADRYMPDNKHLRQQSWIPLGERLVCTNDTLEWSPPQPRGFKYLSITIRDITEDITIDEITFISAHYPVKRTGRFECSDQLLTDIWNMGALTQSINMEDAYDDCVDRERGLYALDMLIQYHVNLACFGDHALMRRSLELYAQSATERGLFRCLYPDTGDYIIPDFSLYIVDSFYCYYTYTGDKAFIENIWQPLMKNLGVFHALSDERADLLLNADKINAAKEDRRRIGFVGDGERTNNTGINCLLSCLYLIAIRGAHALAAEIGKTDDCNDLQRRINILEKSIPETFWNESRGLFADNIDMEDYSPHASLFAVRAQVVSDKQLSVLQGNVEKLLSRFFVNGHDATDGVAFETSYGFYMFDSLYKTGLYNTAEQCIKEGWGWFLSKGLKTTPEHFNLSTSNCHAWAASPTYIMSRYILGINFDSFKGLNHVVIDVRAGGVTWASGSFPHPMGSIDITWHKEDGRLIFDNVFVPDGVTYEIQTDRKR